MTKNARAAVAAAGLLLAASGCRVVQTAAEVPAQAVRTVAPIKEKEPAVDPVEIQVNLMRFADEFTARMLIGVENLRHGPRPLSAAEALNWKITIGTATCSIASGQNAIANLLDMTVFVTEARMSLEDYWQPQVFGESAKPMLESCQSAEAEIWRITDKVLKPDQQEALREAIRTWHLKNSPRDNLLVVRAVGLASQVAKASRADAAKPGNLLGLLMLDPLAELDPARRELAQTRLFAERALYVTQKMPTLLRWQTELLSVNTLEQPALQQWATNIAQIATSADTFARTAEGLPKQISAEREQLVKALEAQEGALMPVLIEARQTVAAAAQLSTSLNTTLNTFDGVLKRLGVDGTQGETPSETNSAPFRILDYAETALRLEGAAKQLTAMLQTFDQTLGANSRTKLAEQISPVVEQTRAGGKEFVDYAFRKGLLFVGAVLLAALVYRLAATLLARAAKGK